MKKKLIAIFMLFNSIGVLAQFPEHVKSVTCQPNATVKVKGNLSQGQLVNDLSWAWKSSVACFPGTQKDKFTGNHVLYSTQIPPHAIMNITVIPDDKNADFSLYAYQIGTTNFSTVPDLSSCVTCEAAHKWDYPKKGKTQDHTRSVRLNAIKNPYNVVIGVVGAKGLRKGGFTLEIQLEGGEVNRAVQEEVKVFSIKCEKGKVLSYEGNLNKGVQIHDLSWAWNSSVACFPETQKQKFTGNHVVYVTEIPRYSKMEVSVVPKDENANFSLYVYEIGTNSNAIVPNLTSCVSCEVDHKWDRPKVGKTQDHTRIVSNINAINNPYKVVIGVVGANGLKEGEYTLKVKLESR
jgi:hypothetical protein